MGEFDWVLSRSPIRISCRWLRCIFKLNTNWEMEGCQFLINELDRFWRGSWFTLAGCWNTPLKLFIGSGRILQDWFSYHEGLHAGTCFLAAKHGFCFLLLYMCSCRRIASALWPGLVFFPNMKFTGQTFRINLGRRRVREARGFNFVPGALFGSTLPGGFSYSRWSSSM